jgi:hypothetical protein
MATEARARVTPRIIGRLRLASQALLGGGFRRVPDAVRWMTAMQAQDLQAALWAVGGMAGHAADVAAPAKVVKLSPVVHAGRSPHTGMRHS